MRIFRSSVTPAVTLGVVLLLAGTAFAQAGQPRGTTTTSLTPELRQRLNQSLARAAAYLKQQQHADGTWENHPGITAMAASALLRQTGTTRAAQMATVGKTLDALAKLAKP